MNKQKKFLLISPKNRTVYNFRGDLLKSVIEQGYEVIVTGPNQDSIDEIRALGVRFVEIPVNKNGLNPVADLRYMRSLFNLMKREKPDITLGYTIKPVIYGAMAAKLAGITCINSMITGVGFLFTSNSLKAKVLRILALFLYRTGLACADHVIFQNRDDKEEFVQNGLTTEHKCTIVNGSGVNMDYFIKVDYPSQITFFMLSRVLYSKGIREYLEAAKKVKRKYSSARFILLGAVENMQDSLTKEDLAPYIEEGIIDYYGETNDVRQYIAQCSVYVLPSYREGTPRTVLEAMAMGRPIITTDAPGCRETVIDGKNGFLVPVKDVALLAQKIEWFINNPEQIPIMGNNSYEYCKGKFDVELVNKKMRQVCGL